MRINGVTGFKENADETIVCKHRETYACAECVAACEDLVDVYGAVHFVPGAAERAQLALDMTTAADDDDKGLYYADEA